MEKSKLQGHVAVLAANTIFGVSVPVTNDLVTNHLTPMGYMLFRCLGAAIIFWAIALFLPREHVKGKDLAVIVVGGLLGFAVSQTFAAWSLSFTTPVYFSLIATLTPIAVMLMAALFIHERITGTKAVGVIVGIAGAMLMVFMGWKSGSGRNDLLGILLALGSLLTWAIYLIVTRSVSARYSSVTQLKWMFLASTIAVIPFAWGELPQQPALAEASIWPTVVEMSFIVVLVTVLGFFFIPYALKRLQATVVSVYTNLQPIVASLVAIAIGQDVLTWDKPVAAVLVMLSAYIVTIRAKD